MASTQRGVPQPYLGVLGLLVCAGAALGVISLFPPSVFLTWVSAFMIAATPGLVVFDLVFEGRFPAFIQGWPRPLRAMAQLLIIGLIGVAALFGLIHGVGGGLTPPLPFVNFMVITAVPVALVLIIVFEAKPFASWVNNPAVLLLSLVFATYLVSFAVYSLFYDFSFLSGAPFYGPALEPGGLLRGWPALSGVVVMATLLMMLAGFDFWPLQALGLSSWWANKAVLLAFLVGGAVGLHFLFVDALGMDVITYQVRVPVSILFGLFIMLPLMETAPFQTVAQPLKGVLLAVCALLLSQVMYMLYGMAGAFMVDFTDPALPPAADQLWIASAMLGFTFPFIVIYTRLLGYFPFRPDQNKSVVKD